MELFRQLDDGWTDRQTDWQSYWKRWKVLQVAKKATLKLKYLMMTMSIDDSSVNWWLKCWLTTQVSLDDLCCLMTQVSLDNSIVNWRLKCWLMTQVLIDKSCVNWQIKCWLMTQVSIDESSVNWWLKYLFKLVWWMDKQTYERMDHSNSRVALRLRKVNR